MSNNTDADLVIRAHRILMGATPEMQDELCDILRRWVEAGKPIDELFREVAVCDDVLMESRGFRRGRYGGYGRDE
jgi:hypothetical protein